MFWTVLAAAADKPKLVVVIVVDQFRYDYLTRYRTDYKTGLDRMLSGGAVFTNAHYLQFPTVTAVGHSIVMTGAMPAASGISANSWYDRVAGAKVTSVCDSKLKILGLEGGDTHGYDRPKPDPKNCADPDPASPERLLVTTVGDELRNRDKDARVVGISFKARSAILPAGHRAQGAYWFDDSVGRFVSSNYYFNELPAWVKAFNDRKMADEYVEKKWPGFEKTWDFHRTNTLRPYYERLAASPWGNELIAGLAKAALDGEKLGQRASTDLLAVSFSANDYVGHQTGPDTPEVRDMCRRTDELIGELMKAVDERVKGGPVLYVLTADHGVAPIPPRLEESDREKRQKPGGYLFVEVKDSVRQALDRKFGTADKDNKGLIEKDDKWLLADFENSIYLNWKVAEKKKVSRADVQRAAAEAVAEAPLLHIARVYTRDQLTQGVTPDPIGRAVTFGFHQIRGADVIWVQEPFWIADANPPYEDNAARGYDKGGSTHSTPYEYDTHVPVIFYGAGVKAGQFSEEIAVNDIAPTLAAILGTESPSGSSGRILQRVVDGPQR